MARKLYYRIPDDGTPGLSEREWSEIVRLQHWYNSEFVWRSGRLALKRFAVFMNLEGSGLDPEALKERVGGRTEECSAKGMSEYETLCSLEQDGLVFLRKGGYLENSLASGWTRVAGNEFNAYLVCDFLLKASLIAPNTMIEVFDEGEF